MHFKTLIASACIALAALPGLVQAQQEQAHRTGAYMGVSVGQSQVKFDDSSLQVAGATSSSTTKDETGTAWNLFAGYRFHKYFAVEGGWTDLGQFSATTTVRAPVSGSATVTFKSSGPHIEGVGIIPIGNFSLFGKAGVMMTVTKTTGSATGGVAFRGSPNNSTNEANFRGGIGAAYDFAHNFSVRAEAEQVLAVGDKDKTGEGDIRLFSVGLVYRF